MSFVAVNLYVTVEGEVGTRRSVEAVNVTVKPPVLPEGVSMEEYLYVFTSRPFYSCVLSALPLNRSEAGADLLAACYISEE